MNLIFANVDRGTLLIAVTVFIPMWVVYRRRNKPVCGIPGPYGWKIFGLLPCILTLLWKGLYFHEMLIVWGKQFGPMYLFGFSSQRMLILNNFKDLKEAWQHPDLNDRMPIAMRDALFRGKGLLFSSGDTWREQRKFTLSVLRSLGVGKRSFESEITGESRYLIKKIRSLKGKPLNPSDWIGNAVSNVICSVTFGKRYEYEDETFKRMFEYLDFILERQIKMSVLTDTCPLLVHMPFGPIKQFRKCLLKYRQCIRNVIQEHHATFDKENLRDFIDVYFNEMRLKREQGRDTRLSEDNMEASVEDLFSAGSETTATMMKWSILLMMAYPNVQSRVQRELDTVVGRDRLPTLADKPQLPYTEATIQEIMRYGAIVPIGAPHYTEVDTTFRGYKIPKGTAVIGNLWSISRDPELWNDPYIDRFNPERFLDEKNSVVKPEHHIVFGSGRRACIGEQLAKMEVFIFFTHILHQFSVLKSPDSYPVNLRGKSGAVHAPLPYETCFEDRT